MSDFKPNNGRIAKNALFLYMRLLLVLFLNIYATRLILNALGVEDYGIYNVVCGFVSLFTFLNSSLSNGIQRFYNFEIGKNGEQAVGKVYNTAFIIQAILALSVFVLLEIIGVWYLNTKMVISPNRLYAANWVFQFSVLSLLFVIMQIPYSAAIMAYEKMDFYAFVGVLDAVIKTLLVYLLPKFHGDKLIWYGVLLLLVSILNFLLYFIYCKRRLCIRHSKLLFSRRLFSEIFKFSGWNLIEMFAWTAQGQGVAVILNLFGGAVINAAYGIASQVSGAINGFCSNLVAAFRPQLVQSYSVGDLSRTTAMMYMMSKATFIMLYMLSIPVILEIDEILSLWLGNNVPEYTSQFCVLILISMIPRNFTMGLSQIVHATGIMRNYQVGSAIVVLSSIPIAYTLLKLGYSPSLVYVAFIFVSLLLWIVDLILLKRIYPLDLCDYAKKVVLPSLIIFVIAPVPPYVLMKILPPTFFRIVIMAIVSVIICLILGYYILLNNSERRFVLRFIKDKFKRK